jgi:hypothetical protein
VRLRQAAALTTNLGNIPLMVAVVTEASGSLRHHPSDVVFWMFVVVVPLLTAFASVRLLMPATRGRIATEAMFLVAVAVCCVVNVFAGGAVAMFGRDGGPGGASAFLLAIALQATGFVLSVMIVLRGLWTRAAARRAERVK